MNYELLKKLKDMGFNKLVMVCEGFCNYNQHEPHVMSLPTLSELIEACLKLEGEHYRFFLCRQGYHENPVCWVAGMWDSYDQMDSIRIDVKGSTPEEAVANLWLKLNQ